MSEITRVYLIPNPVKDAGLQVSARTVELLRSRGVTPYLSSGQQIYLRGCETLPEEEILARAECVIALGGDGTILKCAESAARAGLPILGINLGKVGYMTHLESNELHLLEGLIERRFRLDRRMMLQAELMRGGKVKSSYNALNDAVLAREGIVGVAELELDCDGARLISYRADGVILSTPTGSTAYSFSAGGPVIDPSVDALMATPISPHSLFNRPVVFSGDAEIEVRPAGRDSVCLVIDGQLKETLENGDEVRIKRSPLRVNLITLKVNSFCDVLREKMTGVNTISN